MDQKEINLSDEENKSIVVTDEYLIEIVQALSNLIEDWKSKLKTGSLKLQFAVQLGSKLNQEGQYQFMEFLQDSIVPEKLLGKVLHAFALDLPEWSIHYVLRIYKLAEKTKTAIVMYNDLMDEYEVLFQQFEYDFLEGELPEEDERLEQVLDDVETKLQALYNQAPAREKTSYNRFYGDSSSDRSQHFPQQGGGSFQTIIGVPADASQDEVRKQSRRLLKKLHPDRGGSAYLFRWVKQAYDEYDMQSKRNNTKESHQ